MPPQPPIMRRYPTDAHYSADALAMQRAGWRVASVAREPSGAIVATYTPIGAPVPADPRRAVTSNVALGGVVIFVIFAAALLAHALSGITESSSPSALQPTSMTFLQATATTAYPSAAATILAGDAGGTVSTAPTQVNGALLGGPITAWIARYGSDNPPGAVYQWNTAIAGQAVQLTVNLSTASDARDGQYRAVIIDITAPNQANSPWSAATDAALVAPFLPTDALFQQDLAATSNLGPDHLYRSPQLAASLSASLFQSSATGQQLAPGTFDWVCSTQQPMCELGVGSNS